ncbi:hypothetical protein PUMCH_002757 [Australozyma saopauloensis]|uniref:Uncharacterized protein n=1 Tax=Australozyma saopauloensis TaxID=291208 RepID=A0AAX4HCD2_9ASCO|nr:hypothetical protein PUMCH_002757 [[Candida] saopauloensis]
MKQLYAGSTHIAGKRYHSLRIYIRASSFFFSSDTIEVLPRMVYFVALIFICCVLWCVSPLTRKLDERFMFLSRKPKKFKYERNVKGARYLVVNGCSTVGREVLQNLVDRGAFVHLIHSSEEEEIYKALAAKMKRKGKKRAIVLENCDLLRDNSIIEFSWGQHFKEFKGAFSGFVYFTTECSSLDSDLRALSQFFRYVGSFLACAPNKPIPRVVFASEFGGRPFRRDERYDGIFTALETWQDRISHLVRPIPGPQVAFANTGCIWNDSQFSFAYVLHWLSHKLNVHMTCHQREDSVLHALLSKEESRANGVYFVNDSEWRTAPHCEKVDNRGNTIGKNQSEDSSGMKRIRSISIAEYDDFIRRKNYEQRVAVYKKLGKGDWPEFKPFYTVLDGKLQDSFLKPGDVIRNAARKSSAVSNSRLVESSTIDEKDSSESAPSQSVAESSHQLGALASSMTTIEKPPLSSKLDYEAMFSSITRLEKNQDKIMMVLDAISSSMTRTERDLVSLSKMEKTLEKNVENIVPSQELVDHSKTPEDIPTHTIDQQFKLESTPTLTSSGARSMLSTLTQFMPRLATV